MTDWSNCSFFFSFCLLNSIPIRLRADIYTAATQPLALCPKGICELWAGQPHYHQAGWCGICQLPRWVIVRLMSGCPARQTAVSPWDIVQGGRCHHHPLPGTSIAHYGGRPSRKYMRELLGWRVSRLRHTERKRERERRGREREKGVN